MHLSFLILIILSLSLVYCQRNSVRTPNRVNVKSQTSNVYSDSNNTIIVNVTQQWWTGFLNATDFYYSGDFNYQNRHGKGTAYFTNGDTYTGGWSNDKFFGNGTYTYKGGDTYVGNFKYGRRHGAGNLTTTNLSFSGLWFRGLRHGRGNENWTQLTYPKWFFGTWTNGVLKGYGFWQTTRGDVYRGELYNYMMHGNGKLKIVNEFEYVGNFVNDTKHGEGELIYSREKQKLNGTWVHNRFVNGSWYQLNEDKSISTYMADFTGRFRGELAIFENKNGTSFVFNFENGKWDYLNHPTTPSYINLPKSSRVLQTTSLTVLTSTPPVIATTKTSTQPPTTTITSTEPSTTTKTSMILPTTTATTKTTIKTTTASKTSTMTTGTSTKTTTTTTAMNYVTTTDILTSKVIDVSTTLVPDQLTTSYINDIFNTTANVESAFVDASELRDTHLVSSFTIIKLNLYFLLFSTVLQFC